MERTPEARQTRLDIRASDGHIVPATLYSARADRIVIMSHGITGDRNEEGVHSGFASMLSGKGFDSLAFDFRGHGASVLPPGESTVAGMALDFMAAVQWARERSYRALFHLATSFGASITLLCASRFSLSDFSSVAFWNPVIDYGRTFIDPPSEWAARYFDHRTPDELAYRRSIPIGKQGFPIGPQMLMELVFLNPQQTVWPAHPPLLIVHGDGDTCAPYRCALEYRRKNPGPVTLHTLPGADHGFGDRIPDAFRVTLDFFLRSS
ncbi:MAG: alpha/beta hydrolase [Desulfobacteraceae bacterium]|nr:alpha/beta hydrolase [Desulfobacteraceae bacterium]